jgi:hypothetical protein
MLKIIARLLLVLGLLLLVVACVPIGEGEWQPIPIPAGGSQSAPKPIPQAKPTVPPIQPTLQPTIAPTIMPIQEDETNIPGVREVHAAASREDCDKMLKQFQKQGRNLTLRIRQVSNNNSVLSWLCIFEGPDAGPDVFQDQRSR